MGKRFNPNAKLNLRNTPTAESEVLILGSMISNFHLKTIN